MADGTFGILTKISGNSKGLDVNGYSKDDGASVIQYNYGGTSNQKWVFELVDKKLDELVEMDTDIKRVEERLEYLSN